MPPQSESPIQIHKSEFEEAYKAGQKGSGADHAAVVHRVDGKGSPFLLIPDGKGGFILTDVSDKLANPHEIDQHTTFTDVESFCAYINEFKDRGTKIFGVAELDDVRFEAVLDYHLSGRSDPKGEDDESHTARWGRHKATYNFPQTPEWLELLSKNKKALSQVEFAHMVERLQTNFKEPRGATMLELARTLEATTSGQFKSSINMENGDRELLFTQETNAVAGRTEKIMIPTILELYVQPFIRGPHFTITALFRYRVAGGGVHFEYELVKPHEFIDQAVLAVKSVIMDKTKITPLFAVV